MLSAVLPLFAFVMVFLGISLVLELLRSQGGIGGLLLCTGLSVGAGAVAFVIVPQSLYYAERGWESTGWERGRGTVTSSYTRMVRSGRSSRRETEMIYAHTVDGHTYHSEQIHWSLDNGYPPWRYWTKASRAEALVAEHPRGQAIDVWFDPRDPSLCVLRPGLDTAVLYQLAFGMAAGLAGALSLVLVGRDERLHDLVEGR